MRQLEINPRENFEFDTKDIFGWELILNIYQCNPSKVRSRDQIVTFLNRLCSEILDMKMYGEPLLERFGQNRPINTGYTIVQLVETSSIVAHFSELNNSVYLEIFSCKPYEPNIVSDFCCNYFEAERVEKYFLERI